MSSTGGPGLLPDSATITAFPFEAVEMLGILGFGPLRFPKVVTGFALGLQELVFEIGQKSGHLGGGNFDCFGFGESG